MQSRRHSAVLLVGGSSSRMGQDKARLAWQGCALWEHQTQTLAATNPARLLYSLAHDQTLPVPPASVVRDPPRRIGPIGGLKATLDATTSPLLLVLAVDLPAMRAEYLEGLLARAGTRCGVVPVTETGFEPLAALYPAAITPLVHWFVEQEIFQLQHLLKKACAMGLMKPLRVEAADVPLFRNINRPAQLEPQPPEG